MICTDLAKKCLPMFPACRKLASSVLGDHGLDEERLPGCGADPDLRREADHQDNLGRGPEGG